MLLLLWILSSICWVHSLTSILLISNFHFIQTVMWKTYLLLVKVVIIINFLVIGYKVDWWLHLRRILADVKANALIKRGIRIKYHNGMHWNHIWRPAATCCSKASKRNKEIRRDHSHMYTCDFLQEWSWRCWISPLKSLLIS